MSVKACTRPTNDHRVAVPSLGQDSLGARRNRSNYSLCVPDVGVVAVHPSGGGGGGSRDNMSVLPTYSDVGANPNVHSSNR